MAHPTVWREVRLSCGVWPEGERWRAWGCEGRLGSRACGLWQAGRPHTVPDQTLEHICRKARVFPASDSDPPFFGEEHLTGRFFPTALKCGEERGGGSQQMASGKATCPVQDSGSLAGGMLPTLPCPPPPGATRECLDGRAGLSFRTEPQTLASHWMGPWGSPGLLPRSGRP